MSENKGSIFEEEITLKRRPVVLSGTALAIMSFQTLGVVYSDLGTSPVYVHIDVFLSQNLTSRTLRTEATP